MKVVDFSFGTLAGLCLEDEYLIVQKLLHIDFPVLHQKHLFQLFPGFLTIDSQFP